MLILKKSCKALITALCTLFIYSCSSNDKLDINNYQLQSIQWKLSADDAEKVDTIDNQQQYRRTYVYHFFI